MSCLLCEGAGWFLTLRAPSVCLTRCRLCNHAAKDFGDLDGMFLNYGEEGTGKALGSLRVKKLEDGRLAVRSPFAPPGESVYIAIEMPPAEDVVPVAVKAHEDYMPLRGVVWVRLTCKRDYKVGQRGEQPIFEPCNGVLELSAAEMMESPYGRSCPRCKRGFSSGRVLAVHGDQVKAIGDFFSAVTTIMDFEVAIRA